MTDLISPPNLNVQIQVGSLKLLTSGVLHFIPDTPFCFSIDILNYEIKFLSDDGAPRFEGMVEPDKMVLRLFNHRSGIGEGVFVPFEIGLLNDKALYLSYYTNIVSQETGARRFEYSFYQENS